MPTHSNSSCKDWLKAKTWLVDSSCVVSSSLDFLFFLLVESSISEIVLKIDVGLCSIPLFVTAECWMLKGGCLRMSELLLLKKLLRPLKIVFKWYLTCKPMSFSTWLILSSYTFSLLHLTKNTTQFWILGIMINIWLAYTVFLRLYVP